MATFDLKTMNTKSSQYTALVILVLTFDTQLWTWCAEYHTGTQVSKRPHGILNLGSIFIHAILIPLIENWFPCVVNLTPMVYQTPCPWYFDHPIHDILSSLLQMAYRTPYPWYFDPPTHGILSPLSMVYRSPVHGILNPQPVVSSTPFIWYTEPPTHDISNPLSMVFWTPYPWYFEPHILGISNLYPWYFDHT